VTTNDSLAERFLFNSKWSKDVKLSDLKVRLLNTTAGPVYTPSSSNWTKFHAYYNEEQNEVFTNPYFSDMLYTFPLYDIKVVDSSTGRSIDRVIEKSLYGWGDRGGVWNLRSARQSGWLAADATYSSRLFRPPLRATQIACRTGTAEARSRPSTLSGTAGDNTAIIAGTRSGIPGNSSAITATECRSPARFESGRRRQRAPFDASAFRRRSLRRPT